MYTSGTRKSLALTNVLLNYIFTLLFSGTYIINLLENNKEKLTTCYVEFFCNFAITVAFLGKSYNGDTIFFGDLLFASHIVGVCDQRYVKKEHLAHGSQTKESVNLNKYLYNKRSWIHLVGILICMY